MLCQQMLETWHKCCVFSFIMVFFYNNKNIESHTNVSILFIKYRVIIRNIRWGCTESKLYSGSVMNITTMSQKCFNRRALLSVNSAKCAVYPSWHPPLSLYLICPLQQRLQFSEVATASLPRQQHRNTPSRNPSDQSDSFSTPLGAFPWERDDSRPAARRRSPPSPKMPCAEVTSQGQSEQGICGKEKDYRAETDSEWGFQMVTLVIWHDWVSPTYT